MNDFKQTFTNHLLASLKKNSEFDCTNLENQIWYNLRKKSQSLRLTDEGLEIIQKLDIRTYEVDFPKELKISAQILIWLDRYLDSPYHLNKNKITVITEKAAIELYLFSGDLKKFGISKTINKTITQNLSA